MTEINVTLGENPEINVNADEVNVNPVVAEGKSAYEVAVANGFDGSEAEWLESLVGEDGASAYEIAVVNGFEGTEEEWLKSLEATIKIGAGLKQTEDGTISVDAADAVEQDNTKPITAAAVYTTVGNIEALLSII